MGFMFEHSFAMRSLNSLEQVTSSGLNTGTPLPKHRQLVVLAAGCPTTAGGPWRSHLPSLWGAAGCSNWH